MHLHPHCEACISTLEQQGVVTGMQAAPSVSLYVAYAPGPGEMVS